MRNQILGCYWVVNAEGLENKGIERFSFRCESTSAHQKKTPILGVFFWCEGCARSDVFTEVRVRSLRFGESNGVKGANARPAFTFLYYCAVAKGHNRTCFWMHGRNISRQQILQKCKESGISTAVDTAGHVQWQVFEEILSYTDLFL